MFGFGASGTLRRERTIKKYVLLAVSVLVLVGVSQAKGPPQLTHSVERAVAKRKDSFADGRVKQMCHEWPTCQEWVNNKIQQDPFFQVVDGEMERWVKGWEDGKAVWDYRFYVQTQEGGHIKAYRFQRGEDGLCDSAAVLIKKFPGHPIPDKPTEHVFPYKAVFAHNDYHPYYRFLCSSWPGCKVWARTHSIGLANTSQYIYKWDEQGNALWKQRLYLKVINFFHSEAFYFQRYQTKVGGDYIYQAPVKTKRCPTDPVF